MEARDYQWVDRVEAACLTVIVGGSEQAVLAALGAAPETRHMASFRPAEAAWSRDSAPLQIWSSQKYLVIVEPNGYQASLPETLLAMADGADAVSVFWNINAQMQVAVASHGEIVRTFDPLMYDDGEPPLSEEHGLTFGSDGAVLPAAFVFLERRTGFVATAVDVVDAEHPTYHHGNG